MRRSIGCLALLGALTFFPGVAAAQDDNPFSSCKPGDPRSFLGNRVEPIEGRPNAFRHYLTGNVTIVCNEMTLFADEITYETDTRLVIAKGNVTFQQPDLSMFAERAEINGDTKLGTFYNASGTARLGAAPSQRSALGTGEADVMFHGQEVARTGPTTYRLKGGAFTTCVQPTPRWEMAGSSATITLDKRVLMKHMQLRVKDVPLLYLPVIYYPIEKDDRSTGFLMPTYGGTSYGGTNLSNAFFWAINRSQDATLYHTWNSKSADIYKADYRFVASPESRGDISFEMTGEDEIEASGGNVIVPRSYRLQGTLNQRLSRTFQAIGNANYFTSAARQQQQQDIRNASQRTSSWNGNVSGNVNRLRMSVVSDQRDIYTGSQRTERNGRLPEVALSLPDAPIGRTRIYYGASGTASYFVNETLTLGDRSLFRMDALPRVRASLSTLPFLSASGDVSWRLTRWSDSLDPLTNVQVPIGLNRQLVTMGASVTGPTLARVFQTPNNGYALRFQHVIEPRFSINRTLPFEAFRQVVILDSSDSIVPDTTSITYRLTNRLRARQRGVGEAPGAIRDLLSFDISQNYYSNPLAAVNDPNNRSSNNAPSNFGPLRLKLESAPTERFFGWFLTEIDPEKRSVRDYSASANLRGSHVDLDATWTKHQVIPGLSGFEELNKRHSFTVGTTIRSRENRVGGSYAMSYDVTHTGFTSQRMTGYLNSQCCGVAFDWARSSTPLIPNSPTNISFGLSFTLAGVGSFANPLGALGGMR